MRRSMTLLGWGVSLGGIMPSGCSGDRQPAHATAVELTFAGSIVRDTSDADTTLLRPVAIAVARGAIAIGDEAAPNLRILSETGALVTVLGRKGDGPGELRDISGVEIWGDTVFDVADSRNRRIVSFRRD